MRKLLIFTLAVIFSLPIFAENEEKYSATTQMFLMEQNGLVKPQVLSRRKSIKNANGTQSPVFERFIVAPEMVNGVRCISSFIRLTDNDDLSELESLGVVVRGKFANGLIVAYIPVDKIEDVAAINKVTRINVGSKMRPLTDKGREYTNTDDVLEFSSDAQTAGLPNAYDGSGVLLGITDSGIDFQHIAFKDKDGNYRAVGAYQVQYDEDNDEYTRTEYTKSTMSGATTDDYSDHGTHTCSTAGGSSVVLSGTAGQENYGATVTVTDNHANATYGGMAPGADLWLAGVGDLNDDDLALSFQKIVNYADEHDMPVVISNSWGSSAGPRDGTGDFADVVAQYFGDDYPNHVCLFASSNDAGSADAENENGGYYVGKTGATSSSPLGTILRNYSYTSDPSGAYYGMMAAAWNRSNTPIRCKIYVLNTSTGAILAQTSAITPQSYYSATAVSGLSSYYSGSLYVLSQSQNSKQGCYLYTGGLTSTSSGNYTLAVEFYPSSGSTTIDVWGGNNYGWFVGDDFVSTTGHTWTAGTDDMSVSDEATIPNAISVGAYVSKTRWTAYSGSSYSAGGNDLGDIADFSSYATAAKSPTGLQYPWITAPGAQIVSAVNHLSSDYITGNDKAYRVNTNTTYPYAAMQGTSMATPTAAGIVALWLQVAKENNISLTTSQVKEIMAATAQKDSYVTSGSNASHFGNGKIDALAGIEYILENYASTDPTITVSPDALTIDETMIGSTGTATFTVSGRNLTGNVTLSSSNGAFTVSPSTITPSSGSIAGTTVTVTFSPTAAGAQSATITAASTGATSKTVSVSATGAMLKVMPVLAEASNVGTTSFTATWTDETPAANVSSYTLQIGKHSDAPILTETFANCSTSSNTDIANSLNSYTDNSGWSGTKVYQDVGGVKIGNSSTNGVLTTPSLDLTNSGGKVTVKFNAKQYSNSENTLSVQNGENTASSQTLGSSAADYTVVLDCTASTGQTISFTGKKRAYIYNVEVYLGDVSGSSSSAPRLKAINDDGNADTGTRTITGITSKSHTVTGLTAGTTYDFKVKAVYSDNSESEYTTAKQVTTLDSTDPTLSVSPDALAFTGDIYPESSNQQTFTLSGANLTAGVSLAVSGDNAALFSVSPASLTAAQAAAGATVTVTYAPTAVGSHSATVTATSTGADPVTVSLTGTCVAAPLVVYDPVMQTATAAQIGTTSFTATWTDETDAANVSSYTLFVNKEEETPVEPTITYTQIRSDSFASGLNSNWTKSSGYGAANSTEGAYQMSSGSQGCVLTTSPTTTGYSKLKVVINAKTYGSDSNPTITLTVGEDSRTISTTSSYTDFEEIFDISGNTTSVTLSTSTKKRVYLKNVTFYGGAASGGSSAPRLKAVSGDADNGGLTVTEIPANTKSYEVTGLTAGATYNYKVKAVYSDETESEWSNTEQVTLEGGTPTPELTADATVNISATVGQSNTGTFGVLGENLTGNVTLTLSGDNAAMFSLSSSSFTPDANGDVDETVTVTYAPQAAGSHSATVTITSDGAQSVTVALNGTATGPVLEVDPTSLSFEAFVNDDDSKTVALSGENLTGNVTLTLSGDNAAMFSLSDNSFTPSEGEVLEDVTVIYAPTAAGNHSATLTISSTGAQSVTVSLTGEASLYTETPVMQPATAAQIGTTSFTATWTDETPAANVSSYTLYVNKEEETPVLVETTVYEKVTDETTLADGDKIIIVDETANKADGAIASNNNGSWLSAIDVTISDSKIDIDGKSVKVLTLEADDNNWKIKDSEGQYLTCTTAKYITLGSTGTATTISISDGNATISFGSSQGRILYNSGSPRFTTYTSNLSTSMRLPQIYRVTYASGGSSAPRLKAVEDGDADDGGLTVTGITAKSYEVTGLTAGATYNYKVKAVYSDETESEWSNTEQVTLNDDATHSLAEMVADGTLSAGDDYAISDGNLLAVYRSQDGKTLFCKDEGEYASPVEAAAGQTDYLAEYGDDVNLRTAGDYDQSNWVALKSSTAFSADLVGYYLNGVSGTIDNLSNPAITVTEHPTAGEAATTPYLDEANVFIPSSFGTSTAVVVGENTFFFMSPKPMEVGVVTWACWDGTKFVDVPKQGTMNPYGLNASLTINSDYLSTAPSPETNTVYKFVALITRESSGSSAPRLKDANTSGGYGVHPLGDLTSIGTVSPVTGIISLFAGDREVKAVRYIDLMGRVSDTPSRGINIVEIEFTDGSRTTTKVRM